MIAIAPDSGVRKWISPWTSSPNMGCRAVQSFRQRRADVVHMLFGGNCHAERQCGQRAAHRVIYSNGFGGEVKCTPPHYWCWIASSAGFRGLFGIQGGSTPPPRWLDPLFAFLRRAAHVFQALADA